MHYFVKSKHLFIALMLCLPFVAWTQTDPPRELGPNDFVLLEKEPAPLNMEALKGMIGYPVAAKEANIQGKVIVRVYIDQKGTYVKHIVIKDPHPILTNAVTSKIHNLRFSPGIQKGKPIKVWVTIPFDFKLLDDGPAAPVEVPKVKTSFYSLEEALACPDPNQVEQLFLNGKQLKTFPMEVLKFTNLTKLELGDNQLSQLPPQLASLHQLKVLGLSMNQFVTFPEVVWVMPNLARVDIKGNQFPKNVQKSLQKDHAQKLFPKDDKGKVNW